MPRRKKTRFDLHRAAEEVACLNAVVQSGMPQSTPNERRALRARARAVKENIEAARRSRIFIIPGKKTRR